jgi:hypothetical protein
MTGADISSTIRVYSREREADDKKTKKTVCVFALHEGGLFVKRLTKETFTRCKILKADQTIPSATSYTYTHNREQTRGQTLITHKDNMPVGQHQTTSTYLSTNIRLSMQIPLFHSRTTAMA